MSKLIKRGDIDGHVLNIDNVLCIDNNCNIVSNNNKQQFKYSIDYISGFALFYRTNSTTSVTIYPGSCRSSDDSYNISLEMSVVLDVSSVGVNGLDQIVGPPGNWNFLFVIADSNEILPVATILSQTSVPILPTGYNVYRQIGNLIFDDFPGFGLYLRPFLENCGEYTYFNTRSNGNVLTNGTADVWTSISLSTVVPENAKSATFSIEFDSNSVDNIVAFRYTGSNYGKSLGDPFSSLTERATEAYYAPYALKPCVNSNNNIYQLNLPLNGQQTIEYVTALFAGGNGITMYVTGFKL